MEILDYATKLVNSFVKHKSKKYSRKIKLDNIPDAEPISLSGSGYYVGYAGTSIMPGDVLNLKKHFVAGHGMGHVAEGVLDPLTANAMWVGFENEGILMLSVDVIGISGYDVNQFRNRMKSFCDKSGCKNISISCTHTHGGLDSLGYWGKLPRTGKDKIFMKNLFDSFEKICIEAYENRKSGKLYKGSIHVPEAQYIKRPTVHLRDTLNRLRFVPEDGSAETWLLGFDAHPNTLGGSNRKISPDYPEYLRKTIKADRDVNILFMIGAIGATDPGMFSEDNFERTKLQGKCLGEAALKIDNDEELDCNIVFVRQPFYCPIDNPLLSMLAILKVFTAQKYPFKEGKLGMALKTELTYLIIGNQKIVHLPGEMFPETVYGGYLSADESTTGEGPEINPTPLCEIAGDDNLWVFGITNDMTGYCVAPNDFVLHKTQAYLSNGKDRFDRGHYHETNSLGYNTQKIIAENFAKTVEKIK